MSESRDTVFGYIERIVFTSSETGFVVARLKEPRKEELTTLVGTMPGLKPGEKVQCTGSWKSNPTYGTQFEVHTFQTEMPTDVEGMRKYLQSGMVPGIRARYAARIIEAFGDKTFEIFDKTPEQLLSIPGIGAKKLEKIVSHWSEQKAIRSLMLFLQDFGVSPALAHKIQKTFGEEAIPRLRENPFELARKIPGVGFKTADTLAEKMGFAKESKERVDAGIEYLLAELSSLGHVGYPKELFLQESEKNLAVSPSLIEERLNHLIESELIAFANDLIFPKWLYLSELGIARELERLRGERSPLRTIDTTKAIKWAEEKLHIELAPTQKEAVQHALEDKLHIITGGPGTGKSTITKVILLITSMLTSRILLAAPTGRAAKRLTEITKKEAFTLHSLLQYSFESGGFKRNRDNPLECDLLILDETSMVDTHLMYSLLKALPSKARLLFVGDANQLPSVGPGNVLRDLIESDTLPVTQLTEIFRQAAGSAIILNAHKIQQGLFPNLSPSPQSDFTFIRAEEPEEILRQIVHLVSHELPKKQKFQPSEIQVLTPMRRGPIGIDHLNTTLQKILNPQEQTLSYGATRFGLGDKVMQRRNNYKKEVYNGDIGFIIGVNEEEEELSIAFEGREVLYAFSELEELCLAYATSVHKFQGSEASCILLPCHMSHFILLERNLLYTGVTRGKKKVILIGQPKAIAIALQNENAKKRFTSLQQQLKKML